MKFVAWCIICTESLAQWTVRGRRLSGGVKCVLVHNMVNEWDLLTSASLRSNRLTSIFWKSFLFDFMSADRSIVTFFLLNLPHSRRRKWFNLLSSSSLVSLILLVVSSSSMKIIIVAVVISTRSSATAKSTARPSCLDGVLYDIYRETNNRSTANQPLVQNWPRNLPNAAK